MSSTSPARDRQNVVSLQERRQQSAAHGTEGGRGVTAADRGERRAF